MSNQQNDDQQPADPELLQPQGEEAAPAPAPVVLVVEDDIWTRRAVGRKLQAAGFEVILVPTAADALIVAQRMSFHVLVLDLSLPDVTDPFNGISEGFSMLDWLRRQVGEFKFRIVVHTSQQGMHILHKADEHGVFAVCNKHRDMVNLVECVTKAVESLRADDGASNAAA